jgi:hypothetical protein
VTNKKTSETKEELKMKNKKPSKNKNSRRKSTWILLRSTFSRNGIGTTPKENIWPRRGKEKVRVAKKEKRRSERFI